MYTSILITGLRIKNFYAFSQPILTGRFKVEYSSRTSSGLSAVHGLIRDGGKPIPSPINLVHENPFGCLILCRFRPHSYGIPTKSIHLRVSIQG